MLPIYDDPESDHTEATARADSLLTAYERRKVYMARVDPVCFSEYVYGWSLRPFQDEIHELLNAYPRVVILAPNEHGKTGTVSQSRVVWELGRNPNLRIVIASANAKNARASLIVIKQTIELNPRYRKVFPWLRRERRPGRTWAWGSAAIIVERSDQTSKDFTVQAIGTHSGIEGARIDLFIGDDILDMENTRTEAPREHTKNWLTSTVIPRTTARSRRWFIGTPWHVEDAMAELERNPEYHAVRYDAEDNLWPILETIGGKECGWPEWRRRQREREIGTVQYNRSMRCRPLSDSTKIFDLAKFDECRKRSGRISFPHQFRDSNLWVMTGVDLGVKKKRKSDETVFATVGLDRAGNFHLLNMSSGRMEIGGILAMMVDTWKRYGPELFVVENNGAQDYLLQFVRNPREILGIIGAGQDSALSQIRVEPFTTGSNKGDPSFGISSMTADFEQVKWIIPDTPETKKWRQELERYTPVDHPGDRLMAAWFVWHRLRLRARRQKIRASTIGAEGRPPATALTAALPSQRGRFRIG